MLGKKFPTLELDFPMLDKKFPTLELGSPMLDESFQTLEEGFQVLGKGFPALGDLLKRPTLDDLTGDVRLLLAKRYEQPPLQIA